MGARTRACVRAFESACRGAKPEKKEARETLTSQTRARASVRGSSDLARS